MHGAGGTKQTQLCLPASLRPLRQPTPFGTCATNSAWPDHAQMADPVPYRSSTAQQYNGSFPPPVYYRDTFGLQPVNDRPFSESITTVDSDNTDTTKSTMHSGNSRMGESQYTDPSSYHVEQIITNRVLILHARVLLILILCAFGSALQLLMFAIICIIFGGSPYYACLWASILFILNNFLLFYFLRRHHSKSLLVVCCFTVSVSFIICVGLFFWTSYLLYGEDQSIRENGFDFSQADLQKSNQIVVNTRVTMYSLHLIFIPIQAICDASMLYILCKTLKSAKDGKVLRGYFFSQPHGHQTVLVPVEVKQVRHLDLYEEPDNYSVGIQTNALAIA